MTLCFSDEMSISKCNDVVNELLAQRHLVIASNRGPVTLQKDASGELIFRRGNGGLVTALTGIAKCTNAHWIACAQSDEDKTWQQGSVILGDDNNRVQLQFLIPDESAYNGYYKVIANPLLWFFQHSMWDNFSEPVADKSVWEAWENGYMEINKLFAEAISQQIQDSSHPTLVMLQDYHLYLVADFIRHQFCPQARYTLAHFVHIPWPSAENWKLLPSKMRRGILEGLCSVDLLGFQTREDSLNFIRTCELYLPETQINFKSGQIRYRNHYVYVHDFPISIDVNGLRQFAESAEVEMQYRQLLEYYGDHQIILRIDRIEPSKNIVRGFEAFDRMLVTHPEHRGKVKFLAYLVPSRLDLDRYKAYLAELTSIAKQINARHGESEWEPICILVGDSYSRAVAALQLYNVLLVNSIADGMNLVAKEGPIVNRRNGVLVLSNRTGAHQQLRSGTLVISPLDVCDTADALHQALTMPEGDRLRWVKRLSYLIEQEDVINWMYQQLKMIATLDL